MAYKFKLLLVFSHIVFLGIGIAVGIYILPILIAEPNASSAQIQEMQERALYRGKFSKNETGSDFLHWVEGQVLVTPDALAFEGKMAPGPNYRIYLTKEQAHNAKEFLAMKDQAAMVSTLHNFGNFSKNIPEGIDVKDYTAVQIWCETFSKFIGSAKYR